MRPNQSSPGVAAGEYCGQSAAKDFEIDLGASWVIGDRYSDVELARNARLHAAFVLSGYGRGEWEFKRHAWKVEPDLVCENLLEAVKVIVAG